MRFKLWTEDNEELQQLVRDLKAQYPQLKDLWAWETDQMIELANITVHKEHRDEGIGSTVIRAIQEYATRANKPVVVRPEPEPRKKAALKRFYRNLGFVENKGRHKDYTLSTIFATTMYWRPEWGIR